MPQGAYEPEPGGPPIVAVNRRMPGTNTVVLDQASIIEQQVGHLVALGHERIVYLDGPKQVWATHERRRHAERLASEFPGLEIAPSSPPSFESGRAAVDHLPPDATAVIAFLDPQAAGVISRAAELGIRVPDDLSVVGSTDLPLAAMLTPPLTTARAPSPRWAAPR